MNYYQILQISEDASLEVIKAAYKALAKKNHPDLAAENNAIMAEINLAYETLSDEKKRKKYDSSLNIRPQKKSAMKHKNNFVSNKIFSYMGMDLSVDINLAKATVWKSSIINAGIEAAKSFIRNYKMITNGEGAQSIVEIDIANIGVELIDYYVDAGLKMGMVVMRDYGIKNQNELSKGYTYLQDSIREKIEKAITFYNRNINNSYVQLSASQLSNIANQLYKIYIEIERELGYYLIKIGALELPIASMEEQVACVELEFDICAGKIPRGDKSVLKSLLNHITTLPDRLESYCILYYLYGDQEKSLEQIADFFGMKEQFQIYKDIYSQSDCKGKLDLNEELLFLECARNNYPRIDWNSFEGFYPFYKELEMRYGVSQKEDIDGFIAAESKQIIRHLFYTKSELTEIYCNDESNVLDSPRIFWAAISLLSMHADNITKEEFYAWANKNHTMLRDLLLGYFEHTHKLKNDMQQKDMIDAALAKESFEDVWNEVERGYAYAEYALEKFYEKKCQNDISANDIQGMEQKMSDVIKKAKAGNLCAQYIWASLNCNISNRKEESVRQILELANKGNISAISLKGFWGIKRYNNATKNQEEGIKCLQIGAKHYHPTALAWLGSCYRTGTCIGKSDLDKARKYLELASKYGHPYGIKELEKINRGNTSGSCFITTAVCHSLGFSDDCYELESFRWFRDNWLINQSNGEEIIKEYYQIAPKIIKQIDLCSDCSNIYKEIWNKYLLPCLKNIENKEYDKCKERYINMVNILKNQYYFVEK